MSDDFLQRRRSLQEFIDNTNIAVTPQGEGEHRPDPALELPSEPTNPANFRPLVLQAPQPIDYSDDDTLAIPRRQPDYVEPQPAQTQPAPMVQLEQASIVPDGRGETPPSTVSPSPGETVPPQLLPNQTPAFSSAERPRGSLGARPPDQPPPDGNLFNPNIAPRNPETAVPQPINHVLEIPRPDEAVAAIKGAPNQTPAESLVPKTIKSSADEALGSGDNSSSPTVDLSPPAAADVEPTRHSSDPHDATFARGVLEGRRHRQNRDLPPAA